MRKYRSAPETFAKALQQDATISAAGSAQSVRTLAGIWRATSENQNPPLQYVVYSSTTTETAFQDDRPAGYRTYIYLNLWSDIDPTDMANRIRQAMYDADFWMLEESDKGYNQPAYDPATRTYTVQWTWVYWQDAPLGGNAPCQWNCRALIT